MEKNKGEYMYEGKYEEKKEKEKEYKEDKDRFVKREELHTILHECCLFT